jgi:serine/threonine-protein kinase
MAPSYTPPNYRIVRPLGSGQTSHVYLAEREGRQLALKLPRPELQIQPVLRRFFENEVQITLSLAHDHVVRGFDGYPTGTEAFLVLEYCPGGTLDQLLLEKGQLELGPACKLVLDVATGLSYTHQRSVLHRDVKPANVFLTAGGRAKLGDFGTGIFLTEPAKERVGTAFYMAPEVFRGDSATVQSDIYSLGVLAYEVLTGKRPFVGNDFDSLMLAHTSGLPKNPRHVRPQLGPEMSKVITLAMARDPLKRFTTVKAFTDAFTAAIQQELPQLLGAEEPSVGRSSRQPRQADEKPERRGLGRLFGRKDKAGGRR